MKTAGIIKIVIGCVALVILTAILAGLLLGHSLWTIDGDGKVSLFQATPTPMPIQAAPETEDASTDASETARMDDEKHADGAAGDLVEAAGGYTVSAASVNRIDIGWIAGSVEIVSGGTDQIRIKESALTGVIEDEMRLTLKDGKLTIQYCDEYKSIWKQFVSGNFNLSGKALVIELPESCALKELDVESVSANVTVEAAAAMTEIDVETISGHQTLMGLSGTTLSLSTVSGGLNAEDCAFDELDVESVSGDVKMEGRFDIMDAQSTSGNIHLYCTAVPRSIEAETVSAEITVYLPADAGFTAALDTVSGDIESEFAAVSSGKSMTAGDGACQCRFESVSGGVSIRKLAAVS